MSTTSTKPATSATEAAAQAFAGFDTIEGFNPIDKAELVGVPFGVTGVRFRENDRKVTFAELEIITADGEVLGFQDSSTGVRDQIRDYLVTIKKTAGVEWVDLNLFVPAGLRVSAYDVVNELGQTKKAKTYYLTLTPRKRA